jgi:methylenetetrahydrofolate reductase (NADPH)
MPAMLQESIRHRQFVVTAEIVPPLAGTRDRLLAEAAHLRGLVHAINVTDAAAGRTTMSSLAAAALLAADGHTPILQLTCRDRNRIALTGDLLGAAALGIESVLVLTGDDLSGSDQPDARPVFDLTPLGLLELARRLGTEQVLPSGRHVEAAPALFLGAADTPRLPGADWTSTPLRNKLAAGARFIQTQFCFDLAVARAYMARLHDEGLTERAAFLLGVGPIPSAQSARWMNANLYGVHVPEPLIAHLESAAEPAAEGIRICADLVAALRTLPGVAGVHIMAPARGAEAIAAVLEALGPAR